MGRHATGAAIGVADRHEHHLPLSRHETLPRLKAPSAGLTSPVAVAMGFGEIVIIGRLYMSVSNFKEGSFCK